MKKLKYMIKYLGLIDHYGNKIFPSKYDEWMEENCKGKWFHYTIEMEHNFFFDMEFHFSRKTDMNGFRKKFG